MGQTAGTWRVVPNQFGPIGVGDLTVHGTTLLYPLGTRVRGRDMGTTAYGEAEFIYLSGLNATVEGTPVLIKDDYTTSIIAARDRGAVGLALAATVTGEYGWYQTLGKGLAAGGTVSGAAAACYIIAGAVTTDATAGDCIIGMRTASAVSDSEVLVTMGCQPAVADFNNA